MNAKLRVLSTLAGLAIVVGACGGGSTPAPSTAGGGASQPAASSGGGTSAAPSTALKGSLTIWHSYGSGAGTEAQALKTVTDKISAANPDLKLTIQDIKFDDLFKKFELEAASGGGPDLFIAPNDSLGKEARAGLFLDVTSQLDGKLGNDSQVSVDGSKVDGKLYMVPESLKAVAAYYDKSKIATPPATTDALLAGVKDGSIKAGFLRGSHHAFGFWAAFGGKLMDDTGKCVADTTGVGDAYKYFQDLLTAGAKWFEMYDDLAAVFKSGKID
jgi:arabinogalactan oligomer/maltooligosaccharide transport system substrate-binding protein